MTGSYTFYFKILAIFLTYKAFLLKVLKKLPRIVTWIYTMLIVIGGWGIFGLADVLPELKSGFVRSALFLGDHGLCDAHTQYLVSGHIDCRAEVLGIGRVEDDYELRVALPSDVAGQVVMKGSVAVNGVSLTVASLSRSDFAVRIIPHTWAETNLSELRAGDSVNLETDMLGKFVLRQLELHDGGYGGGVTMETLFKAGF